ncbi:UvrD-helicase domain-containing protein [Tumebacillus sp. DT12]|uniref:DNA 3'-5' helicase n=1 Tax=Tumebacillus lacus TaxID=2995335 RepID=A0ABT3WZH5_9BACL|nr:UvrD-helicase domain-containing protein [Tumebacillus lacus]MCX7570059.1 UvrD-helicase domain-containing protein [Tumebacillus lacus]
MANEKRDVRPTAEQWQAITGLNQHLSVSAGAGAGKTWVLTERYTAMLAGRPLILPPSESADGVSEAEAGVHAPSRPGNIVAITFTKEAAGEMKARVRERLAVWLAEADPAERRRIGLLKEEVERATITTIHGWCSELLREYPLEAGVDPQFAVAEESEARRWLDEAVREVLDEGLDGEEEAVIRLVGEYGYEALVGAVKPFYNGVREQTEDFARMAEETVERLGRLTSRIPEWFDALELRLRNIAQLDLSKKDTSKGSAKRAAQLQVQWPSISERLHGWRQSGFLYEEEIGAWLAGLPDGWGVLIKELKEDVPPLKEAAVELARCLVPPGMVTAVRDVCALLERVHAAYGQRKRAEGALDFTDLQNGAVELLMRPAVREAQAERLRYLMVDEFQDTNPVQKLLLDALTAGNEQLRLFVVGDAKQSIYRFRGADLDVFLQTQGEIRERGGEHLSLAHNFRTQGPIIEFVNRLFARVMASGEDGVEYQPMEATRAAAQDAATVEILHLPETGDSAGNRMQEAKAVARRIQEMVQQEALVPTADGLRAVQYRDVTMLFAAMTHVSLYEHALQEAGIPYYIVGSRHFFRRQEVWDLVQVLQAVALQGAVVPLIGALRSPLFGVSDEAIYWLGRKGLLADDWRETANWHRISERDREVLTAAQERLRAWREGVVFRGAYELLADVLEQTGYEQAVLLTFGGVQKVGNVRKLLDLSLEQPPKRASVPAFLDMVSRQIEDGADEEDAQVESDQSDVVKIMTVHKSKGLEFPVVILPDMAREASARSDGKFRYAPEYGLVVSFAEQEAWNDLGYAAALRERERRKSLAEERRKLYVAMTRARDYLLLVGTRDEPKQAVTLDSSRWFDWLVAAMAEGRLSQMEASIRAEWPEVRWTSKADAADGVMDGGVEAEAGGMADVVPVHALDPALVRDPAEAVAAWREVALAEREAAASVVSAEGARQTVTEAFPLLRAPVPRTDQGRGVTVSVSALMTYLECPRLYFYRYEWRLPESGGRDAADDEPAAAREETALDPALRGTLVHRVLEWTDEPAQADQAMRRALAEQGIVGPATEAWEPVLRRDLDAYLNSGLFREVQEAAEQKREMMFRYALGRHEVTGVLDKAIRREDGQAVVIDFKTNRLTEARLPDVVRQYAPQLKLYTMVVRELLGWDVERAVLYFTALAQEAAVPTGEAELRAFAGQAEAALEHIAMAEHPEEYARTAEERRCGGCGYRGICKGM